MGEGKGERKRDRDRDRERKKKMRQGPVCLYRRATGKSQVFFSLFDLYSLSS